MNLIQIKSEQFDELVSQHKLIFIDFWAPWCAPCLAFAKVYEGVALDYPQITFAKLNVEDSPKLGDELSIRSIPHLLIIKEGVVIYSESGSMPASRLRELAEQAIQADVSQVKE